MRRLLHFFFEDARMGDDLPYREVFAPLSRHAKVRIPIANATWCARPIRNRSRKQTERFRTEYLCEMYASIIRQAQHRAIYARRNNCFLSSTYHLIDFLEGFYAPEVGQV